jgi:hypothetical protein
MDNEFSRLEKVAGAHFNGLVGLSKTLGITKQTFYSYKKRGGFGRHMLDRLEKAGINPGYIRSGEGPMLLSDISNVGEVEIMKRVKVPVLPDLSKLTPEEMKALKIIMEDYLGKINQILEIVDERR